VVEDGIAAVRRIAVVALGAASIEIRRAPDAGVSVDIAARGGGEGGALGAKLTGGGAGGAIIAADDADAGGGFAPPSATAFIVDVAVTETMEARGATA
jgi:hypothetical protein